MTLSTLTSGTRSVRIIDQSKAYNAPAGSMLLAIQTINGGQVVDSRSFSTKAGAERWARKVLAK